MFRFWPDDYQWSFQLVRAMATAPWGGAQPGECLATAARIRLGDDESWHREWSATAGRVGRLGAELDRRGYPAGARAAFGRASQYWRLAEFFLELDDPRKLVTYGRLREAFHRYSALCRPSPEPVRIPYGEASLSAYFLPRRDDPAARGPVVVATGGLESLAEEVHFALGFALSEAGFHVLLLDGPGQGASLRLERVWATARWERPVAAALDFLARDPRVDSDRVGLVGYSLGGFYAVRAAAYEPRVRALVVWGAIWDYGAVWQTRGDDHPLARHLMMIFGARSMDEAREKVAAFHVRDCAHRVRCPTLVLHGAEDLHVPVADARRVFDALRCEKRLRVFEPGEGGSAHVQWDDLAVAHGEIVPFLASQLRA